MYVRIAVWHQLISSDSPCRRGFTAWTALAIVLLLVCYLFLPAPPAPANDPGKPVNVNYVFGPSDQHAQTWLPPMDYLLCMMGLLPVLIFWPTHLFLRRFGAGAGQQEVRTIQAGGR